MVFSTPTLEVFFIDLEAPVEQPLGKTSNALKIASLLFGGPVAYLATSTGLKALGADGASLKRLIDEKRFNIIKSVEELEKYENANGNSWITTEKSLKQKQYYIRHPKKLSRNILIEAKSFYAYIEEEQKDELIDFIMSHCPAKCIRIDRVEVVEMNGQVSANANGADLNSNAASGQMKGNYYSYNNPNGVPKTEPRNNYFWIDKSIMRSISALTEGATLTQAYESDFTFGLSVGEAKTIGLDLGKHKKYSYTIYIEC